MYDQLPRAVVLTAICIGAHVQFVNLSMMFSTEIPEQGCPDLYRVRAIMEKSMGRGDDGYVEPTRVHRLRKFADDIRHAANFSAFQGCIFGSHHYNVRTLG